LCPSVAILPVASWHRFISNVTWTKPSKELYKKYYANHPFVTVSDKNPDLKQVVNTNKAVLHVDKHGNKLHVISLIDNLLKGASGQAVQNMNLMYGLDETTGLRLKPVAF
jgi:N-acetyl-gamma-glutamyl-phosphate reductase